MKLASLKEGGRDGTLIVVSKDLTKYAIPKNIASTMQAAIEDWETVSNELQYVYNRLNDGNPELIEAFDLDKRYLAAPLPRAYQFLDGSVYLSHVELTRKSRGAEMPPNLYHDPLMYQGTADHFMAATEDLPIADESWGLDFEAEVVIVTDSVPQGVSVEDAGTHIKFITLINDVSLRALAKNELGKGFGFIHVKPHNALAPILVTPDELGDAWKDSKLHLPMICTLNGEPFGKCEAGDDMYFNYAQLIHHAAKTRPLAAGTVIGAGTISNHDRTKGSSCIVEKRMLEMVENGEATTPFMKVGDTIRIEMPLPKGISPFGVIEQKVVKA
ncbi:MAG: fumarylacetoacetate (FAA) hydrolase [Alphaproteobacteria bacterium]|jgi:fumarylacetoacetate (FAA) hydrolase